MSLGNRFIISVSAVARSIEAYITNVSNSEVLMSPQ